MIRTIAAVDDADIAIPLRDRTFFDTPPSQSISFSIDTALLGSIE